jgi:RNA polymerase sigma-70 factor, ECF subfamily
MAAGTLERAPFAPAETPAVDRPRPGIDAVYAEHSRYVWRCLRALGIGDAQVDDAIHDVFLVVQQKLSSFDGRAEVTTWLYAICIRVARRYRWAARKDAWRFSAIDDEPESSTAPAPDWQRDPEEAMERGERLALARRALERLDDDKREAFVLSQVEQMSAPQLAEIMGVPLNTAYSRIRAAKLAFQAEITRLELVTRGRPR